MARQLLLFLPFVSYVFFAAVPGNGYAAKTHYLRSWAVEVSGGSATADALAHKYGFTNLGQVRFHNMNVKFNTCAQDLVYMVGTLFIFLGESGVCMAIGRVCSVNLTVSFTYRCAHAHISGLKTTARF